METGYYQYCTLTDGLQMLAINMSVGLPHKPFFLPLFDFVANAEELKGAKEQLVKIFTFG